MKLRKFILKGPNYPNHSENRMNFEGDVLAARNSFMSERFNNLDFLLKQRYSWMNEYLNSNQKIIEIGVGAGFSEFYLENKPLFTDTVKHDWVDEVVDATDMNYHNESIDVIIASHNIHHFYSPYKFFKECERVLKKGGLVIIQEINTSLFMRILLKLMRHEGWSYDVDVFNPKEITNDKKDPWSANCAVPELLFSSTEKFQENFNNFTIIKNELCECLILPLSGGVISKTRMIKLPTVILKLISYFDKLLIFIFPNIFAFGRKVVIKKRDHDYEN